jgi:uncharacterized damage-inducible protein DinB
MFAQIPYLKNYLLQALAATPALLQDALEHLTDDDADRRPDAERFTIREATAHLADFEPIFRGRMQRMVAEDNPVLPGVDEGQLALDNDYAHANVTEQAQVFAQQRAETVAFLQALPTEAWHRSGLREGVGTMSVEAIAHLLVVHDVYHLKQVNDYRKRP